MKESKEKINRDDAKKQIREAVGSNIRRMRRNTRKSLSAEKVAKNLGISRVTLTQIENGKKNINAVLLWELSCLLGCGINDFFPVIPEGFQLSERDVKEIEKIDKKAVGFAEMLFGKSLTKKQ